MRSVSRGFIEFLGAFLGGFGTFKSLRRIFRDISGEIREFLKGFRFNARAFQGVSVDLKGFQGVSNVSMGYLERFRAFRGASKGAFLKVCGGFRRVSGTFGSYKEVPKRF